ncbi:Protein of unknown function [Micromonospora phaseoli]|uniref:DUF998 domain-containing protein n=1 Tax=Micromonospora phaseoli TaxID=1144548 RepID=A0A1H6URR3_9ACTN|nr:DUF998 domain-containing protein [Micromonospora phaseoli]PZV99130.1 uncharacterized protein DUF998 [Micromonospora phaseoli]GIJ78668.1 hypothetical protein Xph01_31000 [Micromonospora phaseoli]SEI95103.1 Protein of unknown function [Micromonospora phaseoli]
MLTSELPAVPAGARRSPRSRLAADAALAGLVLALAAIAVADAVNPQWSWVEHMASHFVHGRAGWLITVAGVTIAGASAMLIKLSAEFNRTSRAGRIGRWMLGVWALGMLVAGVFPADPPGQWDRPPSTAGLVHGVGGLAAFLALPVAAVLLTRAWRQQPRWQAAGPALRVARALVLAAFAVFMVTWVDVMVGPNLSIGSQHTVVGLTERVMLWADVGWLAVAATGLRRMTRAA